MPLYIPSVCICQKKGLRYQDSGLLQDTKTTVCKVNGVESLRRWTFWIYVNIGYNAKTKVKDLHNSYNMYEVRDGGFCSSNNAVNQEIFLNESTLIYCFECQWNAAECFCWASFRMGIKTLPYRCQSYSE